MRRTRGLSVSVIFVLAASLLLASCGKSEFGVTENTGKRMVITAENADREAFFLVGTLEVSDGEKIEMTSGLTKGEIRVEIIGAPEAQDPEDVPQTAGEPILTANLQSTEGASGTMPAGDYMLKATCIWKATGTVLVEVK